ncbi:hypothetical protein FNYG_08250 [Fusarium nygamai]|uniref:Uncharacterized protein n=1 Tax=Gibberella nygamai TaxID=42673 RepID=A0A2K0W7T1_GIBNY|nr:hypothetical protein FNYG_08250 [Fusarium nygamai]
MPTSVSSAVKPEWTDHSIKSRPTELMAPDLGMAGKSVLESLEGLASSTSRTIAWVVTYSINGNGTPLTDETLAAAKNADAVHLGGPGWGIGTVRPEQGLLKLCRGMST